MDTIKLEVQKRDKTVRVKDLRAQSLIPIEYYGRGVENQSFQADYQTFRRVFRKTGGNTLIDLVIDGKDSDISVLVHNVDFHPVTDDIIHVEFANVIMGEAITTSVPLEFVGISPAVKELGGTFGAHLNEVEVKCLPRDLIHSIEVSIESLVDFHASIRVSDLIVPDTVEIVTNPEDSVAAVSAPREEEEEVVAETVAGEEGEGAEAGEKKEEGSE